MQSSASLLVVNKGTFPNPHESLRLDLSFKRMDFKTFVIVCSFAVRLNELGSAVKSTIEKLQLSCMRDQLLKAKVVSRQECYVVILKCYQGLFYFHTSGSNTDAVS